MIDRPRALCYWQDHMHQAGGIMFAAGAVIVLLGLVGPSTAIELQPTNGDVHHAIAKGQEAGRDWRGPDTFHVRFGSADTVQPGGFLLTKLGSLSVMAAHMALRGAEPSQSDIDLVIDAPTMLVSAVIFGDTPSFAVNSYLVLEQGAKTITPAAVRVDGTADRSAVWPNAPRFKAKVVGSFNYADFDPMADTGIIVFPAGGGVIRFGLNFANIK
ncbi:MAG: hypothetical protein FJ247_09330 [Nitrospira sp.]|nr:hypothetical protein [Nitrospira sp.]